MRKNAQSRTALFLLILFTSFLFGCGDPALPAETGVPTAPAQEEEPSFAGFTLPWIPGDGLDPYSGESRINSTLFPLLFEPLFTLSPDFTPEPCLCASYSSSDFQTYTFQLRANASFPRGEALTSADVVYSLKEAMEPESRYSSRFSDVETIAAPDERTVTVKLLSPNASFPSLLDIPIVQEGSNEAGSPSGTGPFLLKREAGMDSLTARDDWWQDKKLPLVRIDLYEVKSTAQLLSAFETRALSLLTADLSGANTPGYRGDYEVRDCAAPVMLYLGCNTAEKKSLLSDPALRRALMRGIDRKLIASSIYAGHAMPAELPVSPAFAEYPSAFASGLGYSREALRTLFEAAGWTDLDGDGFLEKKEGRRSTPLQLKLLVCADSSYKTAAGRVIAETLSYAGVDVTIEACFWDRYTQALKAGEFDLYLAEVRLSPDFDLRPLLLAGGALNYGKFSDPELEALYREARQKTREGAYDVFYARFAEQSPFLPILFKNETVLTQRDLVTGIVPTCQNAFYNLQDWTLHGF